MKISDQEADTILREGLEALQQGRATEARLRFEKLTASGMKKGLAWLLLAVSHRAEGDRGGEETALNRLLEIEPESVRGHVLKGDCRANAGDRDAATYFYKRALRLAQGRQLPQEVMGDLQRAEQALHQLQAAAHTERERRLTSRGLPPQDWSPRLRHSLEIAAGKRQLYLQQPTAFYYPELPQVQYYDSAQFDWAPSVEAAAATIRAELVELLDRKGTEDFRAYIHAEDNAVPMLGENRTLLQNKDWSALFLCENGWVAPKIVESCPRTWETVLQAPVPRVSGWGPTVMFSLLKAGARIAAHTGMFNTRLVCHLPLIVPPNCRFRVGNEVREWEEGKLLIFDDTIEHEAWNDSSEDRVILIFDIWRPELSEQERHELTLLFSA